MGNPNFGSHKLDSPMLQHLATNSPKEQKSNLYRLRNYRYFYSRSNFLSRVGRGNNSNTIGCAFKPSGNNFKKRRKNHIPISRKVSYRL
jgi:hypothetical protein